MIISSLAVRVPMGQKTLSIGRQEGLAVAKLLRLCNNLFDSFNSNAAIDKSPLKRYVTENGPHFLYWQSAKRELSRLKFKMWKEKDEQKRMVYVTFPSLRNWTFNINSVERIWEVLNKEFDFQHLCTRFLNQDYAENFFGQIRSNGGTNVTPTSLQFPAAYTSSLVDCVKRTVKNSNCESPIFDCFMFSLSDILHSRNDNNNEDFEFHIEVDENYRMQCPLSVRKEAIFCKLEICSLDLHTEIINKLSCCPDCLSLLGSEDMKLIVKSIFDICHDNLLTKVHWKGITSHLCDLITYESLHINEYFCEGDHDIFLHVVRKIYVNKIYSLWCKELNFAIVEEKKRKKTKKTHDQGDEIDEEDPEEEENYEVKRRRLEVASFGRVLK